jgi:hypothetical protein
VLCGSLLPLSLVMDWGPTNDTTFMSQLHYSSLR